MSETKTSTDSPTHSYTSTPPVSHVEYCRSCDHTHLVGTPCWFAPPVSRVVPPEPTEREMLLTAYMQKQAESGARLAALDEAMAELAAIVAVIDGRYVSDYMLSLSRVRRVDDLKRFGSSWKSAAEGTGREVLRLERELSEARQQLDALRAALLDLPVVHGVMLPDKDSTAVGLTYSTNWVVIRRSDLDALLALHGGKESVG